jgi:hypothetical protein
MSFPLFWRGSASSTSDSPSRSTPRSAPPTRRWERILPWWPCVATQRCRQGPQSWAVLAIPSKPPSPPGSLNASGAGRVYLTRTKLPSRTVSVGARSPGGTWGWFRSPAFGRWRVTKGLQVDTEGPTAPFPAVVEGRHGVPQTYRETREATCELPNPPCRVH